PVAMEHGEEVDGGGGAPDQPGAETAGRLASSRIDPMIGSFSVFSQGWFQSHHSPVRAQNSADRTPPVTLSLGGAPRKRGRYAEERDTRVRDSARDRRQGSLAGPGG